MEIPESFFSAYVAAEVALRGQLLLRGYEMGLGRGRLGPEEAVAFVEEHLQKVLDDAVEAIHEERRDLKQAQSAIMASVKAQVQAIAQGGVGKTDIEGPGWKSIPVRSLREELLQQPGFLAIRCAKGKHGIAFLEPQNAQRFWARLFVWWRTAPTQLLTVRWEDGTSSTPAVTDTVDCYRISFLA